MSITIKAYSERGLLVKGATEAQVQGILGALGNAVATYNKSMGGYCFSRKREAQIRELVAGLQGKAQAAGPDVPQSGQAPVLPDSHIVTMPDGREINMVKVRVGEPPECPPGDDLPGKWGILADMEAAAG